jgi:hypothetical protein
VWQRSLFPVDAIRGMWNASIEVCLPLSNNVFLEESEDAAERLTLNH